MVAPTILPGRAYQGTDRVSDLLFGWDARYLQLNAYTGQAGTFARSSVGGLVQGTGLEHDLDTDNQLRLVGPAPDQVPRWEWVQNASGVWVPSLRLEDARTNMFTRSEDFSQGVWGKTRAAVSSNATIAPDGTVTADKLTEDATASSAHFISRPMDGLTDNTVSTVSVFCHAAERTWVKVSIITKTASNYGAWFNLATGAIGTVEANATASIEDYGGGWYRCIVNTDVLTGGARTQGLVILADADNSISYTGDGASGIYVWGIQGEEDQPFPSTYIPTAASTVARAAESLSWPFNAVPQPMTVYHRFVDRGVAGAPSSPMFMRIGSTNLSPAFFIYGAAGSVTFTHDNGVSAKYSVGTVALADGDVVELLGKLNADGSVKGEVYVDGVLVDSPAASGAATLQSAWVGTNLYMGSYGSGQFTYESHAALKIARGVRTMDYMRGAF